MRDFLHVDDLCELLVEQVGDFDVWEGWSGNVSGGLANAASLCELTALCQEISGKTIPLASVSANRPNDLRIFIGDCTRLFARTKWRPKRDLRRILQDISIWVQQNEEQLIRL
jgi:CDP-paratose 2-epimerase